MATLVLGVAGAVVGGIATGGSPQGIMLGWSVGATLGGFIDQSKQHFYTSDMGKLSDLRVTVASYGSFITQAFGHVRVPTSLIWGTDFVEHESDVNSGGGSGGPKVTTRTYAYTVSFAIAICKGQASTSTMTITKIFGDDLLIYDSSLANTETNIIDSSSVHSGKEINPVVGFDGLSIRWYCGNETQDADSLMVVSAGTTALPAGSDNPAFRGLCYAVFQDLPLAKFGNRIPNISVELSTPDNLSTIVNQITDQVGINLSGGPYGTLVTTTIAGITIGGMLISSRIDCKSALQALMDFYDFDIVEIDGSVTCILRGASTIATLSYVDMGYTSVGSGPAPEIQRLIKTRQDTSTLPSRVDVGYLSSNIDYQNATQAALRLSARHNNFASFQYPLVLTDDQGRQFAERKLYILWVEKETYQISVSPSFANLVPTDCLMIQIDSYGNTQRARITELEGGSLGEIKLTLVKDEDAVYTQSITGTTPTGGTTGVPVVTTDFFVWSGTELSDTDSTSPGFYVAVSGASGWQGGIIYVSVGGGAYTAVGTISQRSVFGTVSNVLGNTYVPDGNGFDVTNTLNVITNGVLNSTDENSVLNGLGNYGLLMDYIGNNSPLTSYEIFGFDTATLTSTNHYTLSGFLRSQRNTVVTGHLSTDRFVQLSSAIQRIIVAENLIGQDINVKVASPSVDLTTVTAQTIKIATPSHIYASPADATSAANATRTPYWRIRGYLGGHKGVLDSTYFLASNGTPQANHQYTTFTVVISTTGLITGSYTITVNDITKASSQTATILVTDTTANIKTKIEALSNVGAGNTSITGTPTNYTLTFTGTSIFIDLIKITSNSSGIGGLLTSFVQTYVEGTHDKFWQESSLSPIDVSWRYETPGMGYNMYARINIKNTTGSTKSFNWWIPAFDNHMVVIINGTTVFSDGVITSGETTDATQTGGPIAVTAGTTYLIEIFYSNNPATYDPTDQGVVTFITDALANGLTWVDAGV